MVARRDVSAGANQPLLVSEATGRSDSQSSSRQRRWREQRVLPSDDRGEELARRREGDLPALQPTDGRAERLVACPWESCPLEETV